MFFFLKNGQQKQSTDTKHVVKRLICAVNVLNCFQNSPKCVNFCENFYPFCYLEHFLQQLNIRKKFNTGKYALKNVSIEPKGRRKSFSSPFSTIPIKI